MKLKSIHPFYSITLTLLAMAACGYLNKDRLNPKPPQKENTIIQEIPKETVALKEAKPNITTASFPTR